MDVSWAFHVKRRIPQITVGERTVPSVAGAVPRESIVDQVMLLDAEGRHRESGACLLVSFSGGVVKESAT